MIPGTHEIIEEWGLGFGERFNESDYNYVSDENSGDIIWELTQTIWWNMIYEIFWYDVSSILELVYIWWSKQEYKRYPHHLKLIIWERATVWLIIRLSQP